MQNRVYVIRKRLSPLECVAELIDAGELRSTLSATLGTIKATHLREAHRQLESGTTIGKRALAG